MISDLWQSLLDQLRQCWEHIKEWVQDQIEGPNGPKPAL